MSEERPSTKPSGSDPSWEMMTAFTKVAKVALMGSIALSVVLLTLSFLSATSARGPKCAGQQMISGHRVEFSDSFGLVLVCGAIVWGVAQFASGKDPRIRDLFREINVPFSAEVNPYFGNMVAYSVVGAAVGGLGFITLVLSLNVYYPVLAECFPVWWKSL